ncbi:MAG TPA: beta-propeller fold lactonase family protein [Candidatus Acidoferrales bacterium]|nr:beta-propeller fold lactonase family protein [Candidatus Acidoferrales bacterium]
MPKTISRKTMQLMAGILLCLLPGVAWADGAVYAMTNALGNNQILVYHRAANGNLTLVQTIGTGGGGSGLQLAGVDSLGSAGSVQLDKGHHLLFVVNTESGAANNGAGAYNSDCNTGTITSFLVAPNGTLTFVNRVSSGGPFPNSLAVTTVSTQNGNNTAGDRLFVLNAGGPGACNVGPNITGFRVSKSGNMTPVSVSPINPGLPTGTGEDCSAASAAGYSGLTGAPAADFACGLNPPSFPRSPAQIRFTPSGNQLVVTVKGTNTIYVFPVGDNGRVGYPTVTQAALPALPTYFGFTFDRAAHLLVTELFGSATFIPAGGMGAVSSFSVAEDGSLLTISSDVDDGGTAAGTIALEPINGTFAYVANNLSASISSYSVATDGVLTLLNGTAASLSGPNDLATASEGGASFLYVVAAGTGTVGAYQINLANGSLTALTGGSGLPVPGAQGLAAY